MQKDRNAICDAISEMLDNPGGSGIYPTSACYAKLEHYIEGVRMESLGWCHVFACTALDKGEDPRLIEVPRIIEQAMQDLKA